MRQHARVVSWNGKVMAGNAMSDAFSPRGKI